MCKSIKDDFLLGNEGVVNSTLGMGWACFKSDVVYLKRNGHRSTQIGKNMSFTICANLWLKVN